MDAMRRDFSVNATRMYIKKEKTRINVRKSRKIEIVEARDIRRTKAAVNERKRGRI